jgi:hypothetical protein
LLIRNLQATKKYPTHEIFRTLQTAASLLTQNIYSVAQCDRAVAAVFVLFSMALGSEQPCPTLRTTPQSYALQQILVYGTTTKLVGSPFGSSNLTEERSALPFVSFPCLPFPVQRMHNAHNNFDAKHICVRL